MISQPPLNPAPRRATRRSLVAGLAGALALPRALRAQSAAFDVDVAIVGAGAAGIAAAHALRARGKTHVILEARDRVGGRVFTDTRLGAPFDAGAIYIHWAERNPWREIAASLGARTINSDTLNAPSRFYDNGQLSPPRGRRGGMEAVSKLLDTDEGPVPDISIVERVAGLPEDERGGGAAIARMALGDEPENISALDYARLWSGDDLVLPDGYGALVRRHAEGLDIRLSTPVAVIDWSGQGVALDTPAGRLRARAAIVTVPVGVLKADAIRFTPALPSTTLAGLDGLGMGALTKLALKFEGSRFGLPAGGDLWDRLGPRASFDFECWPFDRDIVVALFGGDHARDIVARGEREAIALVLDEFVRLVGSDARKAYRGGVLHGWCADPHSMGCYSHARPGHADARALLAAPVADRLFFAGEATGGDGFGGAMTAGGAYLAGQDAARAISL